MNRIRSNRSYRAISFLAVIVLLSSCKKNRETLNIAGPATPSFITRNMEAHMLDYEWFSAKVDTEVITKGEKTSFKTNLRMKKDSIIWMSISPALGIEVARMIVTPDSIKFLDKWNDQYYLGTHDFLDKRLNVQLDFNMLQDLAVGNPILYDSEEKFKGTKDDDGYILTSRSKPKVRKAAGLRLNKKSVEEMEDTLIIAIDERKYDRVIERFDDEDQELIVKRYWIHAENFKVVRTIISDLLNLRSIEADYTGFKEIQGKRVPSEMHYSIIDQDQEITFDMEYARVKLDQKTTFPFSIPEKFVQIE